MRSWLLVLLLFLAPSATAQPPPSAQDRARALLQTWLAAQNGGDFAAYQSLYAPTFTGVRRSGGKTVSLDRAGWMKDRQRMFGKPTKVEAGKVRIFTGQATARVVFTQTWASGNYSDVGPKNLLLRKVNDGYRILREELFTSIKRPSIATQVEALARFAFVLDGAVVLDTQPEEAWSSGPPVLVAGKKHDPLVQTRRRVNMAALPPELARLAGTRVRVFSARGPVCEAKLGALSLLSRVLIGEGTEPEEAWANGSRVLLAGLVPAQGTSCAGGAWARALELPLPAIASAVEAPPALAELALAAFRKLPDAVEIQKRYAGYRAASPRAERGPADWIRAGPRPPVVRALQLPGGPVLLSVSAQSSFGGCGDEHSFFGRLWGLWEVQGGPGQIRLGLLNQPDQAMWLSPAGAVDSDGDGRPELLFENFSDDSQSNAAGQPDLLDRGVIRPLGGKYVDVDGLELRVLVCPC